jgi:hypothetical protein
MMYCLPAGGCCWRVPAAAVFWFPRCIDEPHFSRTIVYADAPLPRHPVDLCANVAARTHPSCVGPARRRASDAAAACVALVLSSDAYFAAQGINTGTLATSGPEVANVNVGAVASINFNLGATQRLTLSQSAVCTVTGLPTGQATWPQLKVVQSGLGSNVLTIVGAKTPGGLGLALSSAVGAIDIVSLYWDGTTLFASVGGLAFA